MSNKINLDTPFLDRDLPERFKQHSLVEQCALSLSLTSKTAFDKLFPNQGNVPSPCLKNFAHIGLQYLNTALNAIIGLIETVVRGFIYLIALVLSQFGYYSRDNLYIEQGFFVSASSTIANLVMCTCITPMRIFCPQQLLETEQ